MGEGLDGEGFDTAVDDEGHGGVEDVLDFLLAALGAGGESGGELLH